MRYGLTIVGHIVLDYVRRGGRVYGPNLGGPCVYAGLAARALDAKVAVVSNVGRDFGDRRFSWLGAHGIDVDRIRIASSPTTCFRINYQDGSRTMRVTSKCEPISHRDVRDVPPSLAVHIGSVIREVSPSVAVALARRNSVVSLDAQGYVRRLASDGKVEIAGWRNSSILKKITVLKASEKELAAIIGEKPSIRSLSKLGPDIILQSRGLKGTLLWSKEQGMFNVPSYETNVRDPTGAGDALVGGFLASWVRTGDLLWSVAVGSAVASFVVEKIGPASFGGRRQIERRAQKIFDRIARLRKTSR